MEVVAGFKPAAASTVIAIACHTIHCTTSRGMSIVALPGDLVEVPANEVSSLVARGAIKLPGNNS
jgi:hypothetical protein